MKNPKQRRAIITMEVLTSLSLKELEASHSLYGEKAKKLAVWCLCKPTPLFEDGRIVKVTAVEKRKPKPAS